MIGSDPDDFTVKTFLWITHDGIQWMRYFQMKLRNGMITPVFGVSGWRTELLNKEYSVPDNQRITKVVFYAGGVCHDEKYIGGIKLYGKDGEEFAQIGPYFESYNKSTL